MREVDLLLCTAKSLPSAAVAAAVVTVFHAAVRLLSSPVKHFSSTGPMTPVFTLLRSVAFLG